MVRQGLTLSENILTMIKKNVLSILFITIIIYLFVGINLYLYDIRSSRAVCPEITTHSGQIECPLQTILKEDWPTAVTVTIGWLPLITIKLLSIF